VLPAAIAPMAGPRVNTNGKFHAPMTSTVAVWLVFDPARARAAATSPAAGTCGASTFLTFFAASFASPAVLAMSASHALERAAAEVLVQSLHEGALVVGHHLLKRQ